MSALERAGIYVHLPFCPYVCPYCDFAKWAWDDDRAARYLDALRAEIDVAPDVAGRTIFFGGGTPTAYPPEAIGDLIARLRARFGVPGDAEVTAEANPDPSLAPRLAALRAAGVNRLSIGVQSFDPQVLRRLGRRHSPEDVSVAVAAARAAGFDNVSLDLMFGNPGETRASWEATLDAALAFQPDHVSAYGLTIEEGTPYATWFAREPEAFPDDDTAAAMYGAAIARLGGAGYEHYEISNWAKPGRRSAHNEGYWRNDPYVGLGVGAASYLHGERRTHSRDLATYVDAAITGAPIPGDAERLSGDARAGEAMMLALRTAEGVDPHAFGERYGLAFEARFGAIVERLAADGLLAVAGGRIRLTERGRYVANDVCAAFL